MTKQAVIYAFVKADGKRVYVGSTTDSAQDGRTNRFTDQLQTLRVAQALGAEGARLEKLEEFAPGTAKQEVRRRENELIRSSIAEGHPLINKMGRK
jgi:hypothetical protein